MDMHFYPLGKVLFDLYLLFKCLGSIIIKKKNILSLYGTFEETVVILW